MREIIIRTITVSVFVAIYAVLWLLVSFESAVLVALAGIMQAVILAPYDATLTKKP